MTKLQRVREVPSGPLTPEYVNQKTREGWKLSAVEWEREIEEPAGDLSEDVPYGLRIAEDRSRLEENAGEKQALILMMDLIVQDAPLSLVAEELNRKGLRTRSGANWTPGSVFDMLPRLIEAGPRIFSSTEWTARTRHLFRMA
ncbi:MAG TPA: recombinase family protein [Bryobacteraceae bacterium]|nr:recombinase family protein [Bryobacteraceae bacterium]